MQIFSANSLVTATPMNLHEYSKYRGWFVSKDEDPAADGFLVENPKGVSTHAAHKGSLSWVHHNVFMADHSPVEGAEGKPAHEQRVLVELHELEKKLQALIAFTKTDKYLALVFVDRNHLQEQCRAMANYQFALEARVARFK